MGTYKKAKDIATNTLYFIDGLSSAREAVQLMKEKEVHALFIKKRNEEDANGIVTLTDIIKGVIIPDKTLDEVSIYELMTKPVLSIPANLNVRYVPRFLINFNVKVAPVEENGELIGLIDYEQCVYRFLEGE